MRQITIQIGNSVLKAELRDTPSAEAIYAQLPFQSSAQTWGDEVYFAIPVNSVALDEAAKGVEKNTAR